MVILFMILVMAMTTIIGLVSRESEGECDHPGWRLRWQRSVPQSPPPPQESWMKRSLVVWWCWWLKWQAWQVELTQASNSNGRQFQDEGILGYVAGLVRPLWQKVKFCRIFLPAPNSKMQNPTVKPNQCVSMQGIQKSWQAAKEKTNVYSTSNPDTFQQSYYFSQRDFFLVPRCFWLSFLLLKFKNSNY